MPLRTVLQDTVYLERVMPYFAFADTNAALVRNFDKSMSKVSLRCF